MCVLLKDLYRSLLGSFAFFFKFGSLKIWNLLIKCRSERKFFPDPHCLFQTLKLCNRIHNSCFRHSTKKNRLTDGLDSHLLIDFLRTGSGQKEKTEQFRIRIQLSELCGFVWKNVQCNFFNLSLTCWVSERKEKGCIRIPNSSFFLFYRILFPEFYSRVDCFAFFLIRYGLKKNLKGDIVFYTSSAFPVEKEINHSSGSQRFRMKDTFYYQTSEETVFSRFMAYGERKTGC